MEDVPYGRILREGWSIIVIAAVLCAGLAWAATKALPKTYSASSTLMLQVNSQHASLFERNQFSMARIKTYPDLADSQAVIDGVREDLSLSEQEYPDRALRSLLSAENVDDTVLLKVVAEASNAELSAEIANSAASHLSELVEAMENSDEESQNEVTLEQVLLAVPPASPASPIQVRDSRTCRERYRRPARLCSAALKGQRNVSYLPSIRKPSFPPRAVHRRRSRRAER